jgi:hypothetical protein
VAIIGKDEMKEKVPRSGTTMFNRMATVRHQKNVEPGRVGNSGYNKMHRLALLKKS